MARAIMLQGTGSDVGKTVLVAGLARAFTNRGLNRAAVQAAEHVEQRGGGRPAAASPAARSAGRSGCRRSPAGRRQRCT